MCEPPAGSLAHPQTHPSMKFEMCDWKIAKRKEEQMKRESEIRNEERAQQKVFK